MAEDGTLPQAKFKRLYIGSVSILKSSQTPEAPSIKEIIPVLQKEIQHKVTGFDEGHDLYREICFTSVC